MPSDPENILDQDEIEALFEAAGAAAGPTPDIDDADGEIAATPRPPAPKPASSASKPPATIPAPAAGKPTPPVAVADDEDEDRAGLDPEELDELVRQQSPGRPERPEDARSRRSSPDKLLQQAEADLASALAREIPDLDRAKPLELEAFDSAKAAARGSLPLDAIEEVELDLRIELGRTEMLIEDVLRLAEGSVVPLDKLAGDPVDILVNGRLIARGEVLVLNDNFCVRVAEILTPDAA